jgi:hypothetical protein
MASYPITVNVQFDFSSGAVFGYSFIIGDPQHGILGVNVLADSASDVVDVSNQVPSISIQGGYNLLQDQFQATIAKIRILDPNGDWNPQNAQSPYFGRILPNRKVRVSATYAGTTHYLFSGYSSAYDYTYPKNQEIGYVDVTCSDAFRLFQLANISTVANAGAGQDTGTRINKILDQISFPTSMRSIDTGGTETICQADPATARTALQACKQIEATEQGGFYLDGGGNAVFKSRAYIQGKSGKNPTFFSNAGDGINYKNVVFAFDDKLIINDATFANVGGTDQHYTNAVSYQKYFPHSFSSNVLVGATDADAFNVAATYVQTRAETTLRIDALTLDLTTPDYAAGITAALSLDYFDTVRIKNVGQTTSTGGDSTVDKTLQVMGNAYQISPNQFSVVFTTSEPIVDAFIMDSTLYGIIGTSVMTY